MIDITARLAHMIGLGRVKVIDETGPVQTMQIDQGAIGADGARRLLDKVKRVCEFGFASSPPIESEVVLARLGGNRTLSLVIGTNHQPSRPRDLKTGDAMIYDVRGARLWLTKDGIVIDGAGLPLTVQNTPTVTIKADTKVRIESPLIEVTGDVVSRADGTRVSLNALRDAYDKHRHPNIKAGTDTSGGTDIQV